MPTYQGQGAGLPPVLAGGGAEEGRDHLSARPPLILLPIL